MATVEEIQAVTGRAQGVATILAIGTANPSNHVYQADFPDYYFRVTNSEDKIMLKDKFKRICEKSMIEKRYVHLTEETMKENPDMCAYSALSLNARLDFVIKEVPEFGERAATKAIKEWGQPISNITHLVFNASSGIDMPGVDIQLVRALGLKPSVKRVTLYHLGCYAGGTVIRIAKDLAENNTNARVLVVTSEITTFSFRGPCDDMSRLVAQAIFGDGAAAMIIGAEDSLLSSERPLFRVVSTLQNIIPYSEGAIQGHIREVGNTVYISPEVPKLISDNLEKYLVDAFSQFGISDWNSLFWVPHPGGPAILQEIEKRVGLEKDKLKATWHVLKEYGNMSSATVLFILDEMRKKSIQDGKTTTGEGLEWGVLFGFGPGLTVETVVLQSFPIAYD